MKVDNLTHEHIGKMISIRCKPLIGPFRMGVTGKLVSFDTTDGLAVYIAGTHEDRRVGFPMIHQGMEIEVHGVDDK